MSKSAIKSDGATHRSRRQANVLLVDDQPAKLLSYRAILEDLDANLITAGSAREALAQLLKHEFAVVLIDVCMPELDGFELAGMIRDHPRFRRTALIFISAVHLTDLDRLKGYQCGAVDYLPVPIVPDILRAKVSHFVELHLKTRELERLNRSLERRVAQRTAELLDANRRKDEFLAMLAHELRNPLAAIRMATHSIDISNAAGPDGAKWTDVIDRQLEHLVRLVDDLVDVSRITRGVFELRRTSVDISSVITEAVEAVRPLVEERQHTLTIDLAAQPLTVSGDGARLVQVVSNVLNNAAKFTKKGGTIALSTAFEGAEAIIRIRDNGIGIDRATLPKIFEMFTHVSHPLERPSGGLGIGLALVRRLVEMHGGRVTANSQGSGTGTEIVVRLPLLETASETAPPAGAASQEDSTPVLAPCRILVADDNTDAAETLAYLLRASGHQVETANDGFQAMAAAPAFDPDVVLLDLGMPGLNGYETARRMRQQPWGSDVALVALTGWGQQKDRTQTMAAGFDAHLVKPVGRQELLEALSRVMRRKPRQPES